MQPASACSAAPASASDGTISRHLLETPRSLQMCSLVGQFAITDITAAAATERRVRLAAAHAAAAAELQRCDEEATAAEDRVDALLEAMDAAEEQGRHDGRLKAEFLAEVRAASSCRHDTLCVSNAASAASGIPLDIAARALVCAIRCCLTSKRVVRTAPAGSGGVSAGGAAAEGMHVRSEKHVNQAAWHLITPC